MNASRSSLRKSKTLKSEAPSPYSSRGSLSPPKADLATPPPAEIIYKLSKKIAQLTKVIYYLNTKNEDQTVEIHSLAEAYEDEIQEVISDGRTRISNVTLLLEDSETRVKAKDEIIEGNETKVTKLLAELEDQKHHAESLEAEVALLAEKKQGDIGDMQKEMRTMAQTIAAQKKSIAELTAAKDEIKRRSEEQGTELQNKLTSVKRDALHASQELSNFQEESKNTFEKERAAFQQELEAAAAAAKAEAEQQAEQFHQEMEALKSQLRDVEEQFKVQLDTTQSTLASQFEAEHARLVECQRDLSNATANLQRKTEQCAELQRNHDRTVEMLKGSETAVDQSKEQIALLNQEVLDLQKKLKISDDQMKALNDSVGLQAKDLRDQTTATAQLLMERSALADRLQETTTALDDAKATIQMLEEQYGECEEARGKLARNLAEAKQQMFEASVLHKETLASSLADQKAEMDAQRHMEITALQSEMIKFERETSLAREQERTAFRKQLDEQQALMAQKEEEWEAAKKSLQSTIAEHTQTITILEIKLADLAAQFEAKKVECEKQTDKIEQLDNNICKLEIDKADLIQKMQHLEKTVVTEMQNKHEKDLADAHDEWQDKLARDLQMTSDNLAEDHDRVLKAVLARREAEYESQVQAIRITHQKEIAKLQKLISAGEKEAKVLNAEKDDLLAQLEEKQREHDAELKNLANHTHTSIEEARKQWQAETTARETQLKVASTIAMSQLEKKMQTEKQEMNAAHQKRMDDLRTFFSKSSVTAKKEAEAAGAAALAQLRAETDTRYAELDHKLRAQKAEALKIMKEAHDAEVDKMIKEHDADVKETNALIEKLVVEVNGLKTRQEEMELQITDLETIKAELEESLKDKIDEISALRDEMITRLEILKRDLLDQAKQDLDANNATHLEEQRQMLGDFEEAQAFFKRQLAAQAKKLDDADIKYINREPRDVDLKQINELEERLDQGKQIIAALMEEVDYFKLELNNREANFNKIFNKTPIVGFMQPFNKQSKSSKSFSNLSTGKLPPLPLSAPTATPP
ncbi:uncharacterized protein EV422DRAFT_608210 [Fimicolochytrium jonesii]|uniref:uncharacterized protein n=1 Tax=Fimicolochytrium jonesii TaxID=1396493 RepID=UPI0022FE5AF4|nr:uncharacterized protein EV422DRAFT_608210 [Fimicolochytrium jonesii]KAI8816425.1 hypothetical protein EV422DRAFT_608210 [Fimicolochytrium jonesii]